MWAFALWDRANRQLFCSRDRFGVKPLYYRVRNGAFAFASEPKGIFAAFPEERRPDWGTLHQFLTRGIIMEAERSFYESIRLLPPAHNLILNDRGMRTARFWNYPQPDAQTAGMSLAAMAERFRELFIDAVRLRARSDVEIGTTLSGGLDSTAIVAAYRSLFPDVAHRSYSAVFTGRAYDESDYIDAVVRQYRLQSLKIPQTAGDLLGDLRELVRKLDSPLISPAIVPLHRVMKAVHADGTKVIYDGQGADELLAGYDNQFYPAYLHSLLSASGHLWDGRLVTALRGMTRDRALWTARYAMPWLHPLYHRLIAADGVLADGFGSHADAAFRPRRYYADPLNETLYQAHSCHILPGLLHYGDGVSMASSVEYRLPFMDYRLVEFGFQLPAAAKMGNGWTKLVLRDAMAELMIDKVRLRRWKNGFHTPLQNWIAANPDVIANTLSASTCRDHGIFNQAALLKLLKPGIEKLGDRLANHVLRWVTTELWMQECIDRPGNTDRQSFPPNVLTTGVRTSQGPKGAVAQNGLHAPQNLRVRWKA